MLLLLVAVVVIQRSRGCVHGVCHVVSFYVQKGLVAVYVQGVKEVKTVSEELVFLH